MRIPILIGCVVVLVCAGCKPGSQSTSSGEATNQTGGVFPGQSTGLPGVAVSEWAKVKIDATGVVFVNKKQMTTAEFKAECARLKKGGGAVQLYVDAPNRVLSAAQSEVVRQIADSGIGMKMAMKESDLD